MMVLTCFFFKITMQFSYMLFLLDRIREHSLHLRDFLTDCKLSYLMYA